MMLTVKEVAERLRVSGTCVYQLVEKGKLPCHRIGLGRGAIRICEGELSAFVERCRYAPDGGEESHSRPEPKLKHLRQ